LQGFELIANRSHGVADSTLRRDTASNDYQVAEPLGRLPEGDGRIDIATFESSTFTRGYNLSAVPTMQRGWVKPTGQAERSPNAASAVDEAVYVNTDATYVNLPGVLAAADDDVYVNADLIARGDDQVSAYVQADELQGPGADLKNDYEVIGAHADDDYVTLEEIERAMRHADMTSAPPSRAEAPTSQERDSASVELIAGPVKKGNPLSRLMRVLSKKSGRDSWRL
jgi:hypothetical protein